MSTLSKWMDYKDREFRNQIELTKMYVTSLAYFCRLVKNWEGYYVSKSCVHNVLDRNLADIFIYLSFILSLLWILYVDIIVGSVVIRRNVEFICWYFKGFIQKRNIFVRILSIVRGVFRTI